MDVKECAGDAVVIFYIFIKGVKRLMLRHKY